MDAQKIKSTLTSLRPELDSIGVVQIALFGSITQQPEKANDVDIWVEFDQPTYQKWLDLIRLLEKHLNHPVDITVKGSHLSKSFLSKVEPTLEYVWFIIQW